MEYKRASKGCSLCYGSIFTVANRGTGNPAINDRDRRDPYVRQKSSPFGNNNGEGYNLTKREDEDWEGAGFGGRARKGFPPEADGSSIGKYDDQREKEIPGSYDAGEIDVPGDLAAERSYKIPGEFASPSDALSRQQQISRDLSGNEESPMDEKLKNSRNRNTFLPDRDDSIFSTITRRQKGVQR